MTLKDFFDNNNIKVDIYGDNPNKIENIVGKRVWICDYRNNEKDVCNKPIRHIKPTYVEVCLPTNNKEQVYYSPIHFKEVGKNGKLKSKVIAPYDNTRYRSYTGVSVNIFLSENECKEFYKQQVNKAIHEIKEEIKRVNNFMDSRVEVLENELNYI